MLVHKHGCYFKCNKKINVLQVAIIPSSFRIKPCFLKHISSDTKISFSDIDLSIKAKSFGYKKNH